MKFLQINLHHNKAATAALCQQLAEGKADIALIQEPWLYKGRIKGLNHTGGTLYSVAQSNNAGSCVYIRNHVTPPTKEMRDIIDYCFSRKNQLIIGCDANEHHILWGSTGTNPRGESLMEFLVSSNLNILNHGKEPTFVVWNRKGVIGLTLETNNIENLVSNWHVSDELSLLDHRYICFEISNITVDQTTYGNPKRNN
ncbi:hypothetical protein B7P43_G17647 [Cryptotermes secundus]|uniref:Endonuclease/exonuclease/phosphatase domain-containing protein n=1 Tax=Cryptotermes secundus TaxID=105785 RepID=A0A2J7QY54_9NEOP|nr:hypothetical protein B7P43_G17647 [Cryptotermes secundus]